ncbi:hypothetical protein BSKO_06902 [Bryopsis sp. KO-2023]|nr:hypothetical protein BSKO_06902 [Bryopsis sp. KO-2023]
MDVKESTLNATHANFTTNTAYGREAPLDLDGGKLIHESAGGGAIALISSEAFIVNSRFTENTAFFGGAITFSAVAVDAVMAFIDEVMAEPIYETLSQNSTLPTQKPTMFVEKSVFRGNRAWKSGGAVALDKEVVVRLVDTDFEVNIANASGGAVSSSGAEVEMDRGNCIQNHARDYGGAIWIGGPQPKAQITNLTFVSNNSTLGGAIFVEGDANSTLAGCTFFTNQAHLGGGAVCAQDGDLGSTGRNSEGGLHIAMKDLKFSGNRFLGNTAAKGGAGLEVKGVKLHCRGCGFRKNVVENVERGELGGGGGILATSGALLTLHDCTVTGCFAGGSGGGIYAQDAVLKGSNLTVSENVAGENGGGMAAHFSSLFTPRGDAAPLWECTLCSIENNEGKVGGGLHLLTVAGSIQDCKALAILGEGSFRNGSSPKEEQNFFQLLEECSSTPTFSDLLASRHVLSNDTTFKGNFAEIFASDVFSNDISVLRMCCGERCFDRLNLKNAPQSCHANGEEGGQAIKKLTKAGRTLPFTDSYPQCEEGYMGVLCGSCQLSHGKLRSHECVQCRGQTAAILFFSLVALALMILSFVFMKSAGSYSRELNNQAGGVPTVVVSPPTQSQSQDGFNLEAFLSGQAPVRENVLEKSMPGTVGQRERRASDVFKVSTKMAFALSAWFLMGWI